jgi:hypothetical protein
VFAQPGQSELGHHYRLDDGNMLCGVADGIGTRDPWGVTCGACMAAARAESVDQPGPHPFLHTEHCSACLAFGPRRRYDARTWNGHC